MVSDAKKKKAAAKAAGKKGGLKASASKGSELSEVENAAANGAAGGPGRRPHAVAARALAAMQPRRPSTCLPPHTPPSPPRHQ